MRAWPVSTTRPSASTKAWRKISQSGSAAIAISGKINVKTNATTLIRFFAPRLTPHASILKPRHHHRLGRHRHGQIRHAPGRHAYVEQEAVGSVVGGPVDLQARAEEEVRRKAMLGDRVER